MSAVTRDELIKILLDHYEPNDRLLSYTYGFDSLLEFLETTHRSVDKSALARAIWANQDVQDDIEAQVDWALDNYDSINASMSDAVANYNNTCQGCGGSTEDPADDLCSECAGE